ncbi:MAG: hypothetical protein RIC55_26200 [Pirellulaceae bacterium]
MIDNYAAGVEQLRRAAAGMSDERLDAAPIAGQWPAAGGEPMGDENCR